MPIAPLSPEVRHRYHHLTLADPKFDIHVSVDILLGSNIFPQIVRPKGDIVHTVGVLSAFNIFLGWVVFGAVSQMNPSPSVSLATISTPSINEL